MKKYYVFLLVLLLSAISHGQVQQWVANYSGSYNGNDFIDALLIDGNYNVFVSGTSQVSLSASEIVSIKYNYNGGQLWLASYNSLPSHWSQSSEAGLDDSGNIFLSGYTSQGVGAFFDYATLKYNVTGNLQWVKKYDSPPSSNDYAYGIAVDNTGFLYITGESPQISGQQPDIVTIKYNKATGDTLWVRVYNGPANGRDIGQSIAFDQSGNVYVTGQSVGSTSLADYVTIKYNSAGVQQWATRYNGPGNDNDYPYSIAVDNSGNSYVTGYSTGSGTGYDFATIKYNSSGSQVWVRTYNGTGNGNDFVRDLVLDGSANVYIAGGSIETSNYYDYSTIKYNTGGTQQWISHYNGPDDSADSATDLCLDQSGNVYVTGESEGVTSDFDFATIKYNSSGVQQWVMRYNGLGNGPDTPGEIAVSPSGNMIIVAGRTTGVSSGNDYTTVKYGITPAVPALLSPPDNATGQSLTLLLDWSDVPEALSFSLQISTNINFTTTVVNQTGIVSSQYQVPSSTLSNNVYYYWRVLSDNAGGQSAWTTPWRFRTAMLGVNTYSSEIPKEFKLYNGYPNPFNPITKIRFDIPKESETMIIIYDLLGKEAAVPVNEKLDPGAYEVDWNASNYPSGVYFYMLQTDSYTEVKKMVLIK